MKRPAFHSRRESHSLRGQLLRLMAVTSVLMLIIVLLFSYRYIETQRDNIISYQSLYAGQLAHSTRQAYSAYRSIAYSVAYNQTVQDYIGEKDHSKRYATYSHVYNLLNNTLTLNTNLKDIAILSPDGNSLSLSTSPRVYDIYMDQIRTSGNAFRSHGTLKVDGTECHILSIPIHILSAGGTDTYLGTVLLAINNNRFFNANAQSDADLSSCILLTDENDTLLYGSSEVYGRLPAIQNAEETPVSVTLDGHRYLIWNTQVSDAGIRLYYLFDLDNSLHASLTLSIWLSIVLLVVLSLLMWSFLAMWLPVSASLGDLTHIMEDISRSDDPGKVRVDPDSRRYSCQQTSRIFHAFDHMLQENDHLNDALVENYTQMMALQVNNRQTEIAFLRSQINPHFLYNTLTTICGMAADEQNDAVIEVTGALGNIFRYSIQGSEMVTVTEEMSIVGAYLRIQSYRFEDRIRVSQAIAPQTLECRIPKMVIQPLVQNAINHGLEPSLRPCLLTIETACEDGHLVIRVSDTGVGMSAERLQQIRQALEASTLHRSANAPQHLKTMDELHHSGIGLLNVNSRIVLHYGPQYTITIASVLGEGTSLRIRIPMSGAEKGETPCIPPSSQTMKST